MPTYEYICTDCTKRYDVFHKVREVEEDVICPSCGSRQRKRMISMTSVSMAGISSSSYSQTPSSCETGSCCGGACNI